VSELDALARAQSDPEACRGCGEPGVMETLCGSCVEARFPAAVLAAMTVTNPEPLPVAA